IRWECREHRGGGMHGSLGGASLSRHSQRIAGHPDIVRESGVSFVNAVDLFGDALGAVSNQDLAHAELQHVRAMRVDEAGSESDTEAGAAESQIVADQIARGHALVAECKRQPESSDTRRR